MAWNKNLDVDKPPDVGESPSLGAGRIRDFKNAICERLTNWLYGFKTDDLETDEGLKKAPLKAQDPAPSEEAGKVIVYAKNIGTGGGKPELFVKDEDGNEIQITTGGVINPGVIDHGGLLGLADDDHAQYFKDADHTKVTHDALALDHGALGGKGDNDHPQYLSQTSALGTHSADTIYQNTRSRKILVVATFNALPGNFLVVEAYIGSGSPPGTAVAYGGPGQSTNESRATITFVVPPSYYWKIVKGAGTGVLRIESWEI